MSATKNIDGIMRAECARVKGRPVEELAFLNAAKELKALKQAAVEDGSEADDPGHVDSFIWRRILPGDADPYAQWMLMHFRLPAVQRMRWDQFIKDRKLFCTWEGKRWRVTGASRLGDVWLASDFARDCGYDKRVDVNACTEWGPQP